MFFYIAVFIILLLPILLDNSKFTKKNNIIYYLILPLFLCFGYMNGSDWRNYEIEFYEIDSFREVWGYGREKGYTLIGYFFKLIGLSFWHYAITIKLIGYYIFLTFYKKYSESNLFGLIFFFANFSLFLWLDHPARNFCAILVYLFSFKYIFEKSFVKYLLIIFLATFFHLSALFLLPVYFFNKSYSRNIYIILVIISVILFLTSYALLPYITSLFEPFFFFNRFDAYLNEMYIGKSMNVFRYSLNIFIIVLAIIKKKKFEIYKYGTLMLNLSIIYLLFFSIGNINVILFRFNLYYAIPFAILISYLFTIMHSLRKKIFKYAIIMISFLYMYQLITKDFRYIPYTNYLSFSFQAKPNYYYRSNYNYNNSPYSN